MDSLATAHAQTLHFGWAYNRVKKPLCKNFEAKEGMGVYSRCRENKPMMGLFSRGYGNHKVFLECLGSLILKRLMHTVVKQMVVPSNLTLTAPLSLTDTEENVVRYVAGYVVMKLKKKYRKHHHQYASVLDTMKTSLDEYESNITSIHDYSRTWTEQRDRGGLYHVNDKFFSLTKAIELVCRRHLDIRTDPSDDVTCYPR